MPAGPITATTALTLARTTLMASLIAATGGTEQKQAHYQYLPPITGAWALFLGGGGRAENTWNQTATELMINADLEGFETTLEAAETKAMQLTMALPIREKGNVQLCRIRQGGLPDIAIDFIKRANDPHEVPVWHWSIGLEVVLATTKRYT